MFSKLIFIGVSLLCVLILRSGRSPGAGNGNPLHILAWRIPWTEEPGGLQSMEWQRLRHGLVTKPYLLWWLSGKESACQGKRRRFDPWVGKIHWRRKWQPTPVFWPGESHGQRSLAGYSPWSRTESDTTDCAHTHTHTRARA